MRLYNRIMEGIGARLGGAPPRRYPYDPAKTWPETPDFELVMLRDAAFELGGDDRPGVTFTCVTTDPALVPEDETLVYGAELPELAGSAPYARIALLRVGDIGGGPEEDTEEAFRAIQEIDFVRYHVFPEGFMLRTSSEANKEQVRVSRSAVSEGITFERLGNTFIGRYRQNADVLAAKLIFITAPDADYKALAEDGKAVRDITLTLTGILQGLPTDCSSCSLRAVCDEVEGLRELHFGRKT